MLRVDKSEDGHKQNFYIKYVRVFRYVDAKYAVCVQVFGASVKCEAILMYYLQ